MRMNKKIFPLMAAAAMMLLTACYHDKHEFQPNEHDGTAVGYVSPQLSWENETDTLNTLDHIQITVAGSNGTSANQSFGSVQSTAEWLQQLPVGEYDLLVTADMDEARGYVLNNVTHSATRAEGDGSINTLPDTRVSLRNPSSSPEQAWYGVTSATVKADEVTIAEVSLRRLLASVTVVIHGVPAGTTVSIAVERVAHSVLLTTRDGNGRYGVPDGEDYETVSLGTLAADPADAATLRRDDHTLMPTAGGQQRCLLTISVTTPEGTPLTYLADAPRMECGKHYLVELDYADLRPYMRFEAMTINDWTEGWTISGEILNPTNK